MKKLYTPIFAIVCLLLSARVPAQGSTPLKIKVQPSAPLIETRDGLQVLNFDLAISNRGSDHLKLTEIELNVFDASDHLVSRKTVNSDGFQPGVEVVAKLTLAPAETVDVFNPFFSFDAGVPLHRLHYIARYLIENSETDAERNRHRLPFDYDVQGELDVFPQSYVNHTELVLPLRGTILVWEGHDFFAHHRRIQLDDPRVKRSGMRANFNRYAMDLIVIGADGQEYKGSPYDKENWYSYGVPIYAPGTGKVMAAENSVPDNWFEGHLLKHPQVPEEKEFLGNFVLIDHGHGEYSIFPHMKAGSVLVKPGETVQAGEMVGRVGFSGDAIFPHVHYSLMNSAGLMNAEGLPVYFHHFRRNLGANSVEVSAGQIDSGDIVESKAHYTGGDRQENQKNAKP